MSGLNFLSEMGKTLTDNKNFSLDLSQDTESQVSALALGATQLMGATAKISEKNLTGVLLKAKDKIIDDSVLKKIDEDKIIRLIHLSTQFSSEEMQEYVAGILAGEYNHPGSFSFRTLEIVKNLGKEDIELFRKFGGLVFDGEDFFSNLYNLDTNGHKITDQEGIGYDKYLHLVELGLVLKTDSARNVGIDQSDLLSDLPSEVLIAIQDIEFPYTYRIQGQELCLKKRGKSRLEGLGYLTLAGKELFPIIGFEENDTLLELVKSEFIRQGFYE